VFEFSLTTLLLWINIPFTLPMEAGDADYTTTQTVTACGATTGTVSVPTTADTIAVNETFTIALERLATGTINDNDAAQL
jgi:hypothetical protein